MSRSLRWIAVTAACATLVAGAALAVACDGQKTASNATKVSAEGCAAKASTSTASVACTAAEKAACSATKATAASASAGCSAAEKAACSAKAASFASAKDSQYLCDKGRADLAQVAPFSFVNELDKGAVDVAVQRTDNGFAVVFASASPKTAMAAAEAGKASLGKPASCSYTRANMAEKAGGCKTTEATLSALADCNVSVDSNEAMSRTVVSASEEAKIKELHAWLDQMGLAPASAAADAPGE